MAQESRRPEMVVAVGIMGTVVVCLYGWTINDVFRSDFWIFANVANHLDASPASIWRIMTFEMFGDQRFLLGGHLLLFLERMVFGNYFYLYHGLQIGIHFINAILVQQITYQFTKDGKYSLLGGVIFASMFSHFDLVNWTFHIYILVSATLGLVTCLLLGHFVRSQKMRFLCGGAVCAVLAPYFYEPGVVITALSGIVLIAYCLSRHQSNREAACREVGSAEGENGSWTRLVGALLAGVGVVVNPWLIGWLATGAGRIDSLIGREIRSITIGSFSAACLLAGGWLLTKPRRVRLAVTAIIGRARETAGTLGHRSRHAILAYLLCSISGCIAYALVGYLTLRGKEFSHPFAAVFKVWALLDAVSTTIVNFFASTLFLNVVLPARIIVRDIVYLEHLGYPLQAMAMAVILLALITVVLGVIVCRKSGGYSNERIDRTSVALAVSFLTVGLAYFFIIALGRTGRLHYVMSQPRYQYFLNAMVILGFSHWIWRAYSTTSRWKAIIWICALYIAISNSANVVVANREIHRELLPFTHHVSNIETFGRDHPGKKIFVNFSPGRSQSLYLGSDIGLDVLFWDRDMLTKSRRRADYEYNGRDFVGICRGREMLSPAKMEAFYIEFAYHGTPPDGGVTIVGGNEVYPQVVITSQQRLQVRLQRVLSDQIDSFESNMPVPNDYRLIGIEKDGDFLCFIYDGRIVEKLILDYPYKSATFDDARLLNPQYMAYGSPVWVHGLFIMLDSARYHCLSRSVNDRVAKPLGPVFGR